MTEETQTTVDVADAWNRVTGTVKQRIVMPSLWRAMENAKPLVAEEDDFVVGFGIEEALHAHMLQDVRYRNVVEQCLEEISGRRYSLRTITGDSVDDWREIQAIEREAALLRAQGERRAVSTVTAETWDGISEQLTRRFSETQARQLPSVQAEFLEHAVGELASAYGNLMKDVDEKDESQLRAYGRVLDRIADRISVPSTMIAYMVLERRRRGSEG